MSALLQDRRFVLQQVRDAVAFGLLCVTFCGWLIVLS
jgi:TM2 domain-containing membrane protein YozV